MGAFSAGAWHDRGFGPAPIRCGVLEAWFARAFCRQVRTLGVARMRLEPGNGAGQRCPEKLDGSSGQMRGAEHFSAKWYRLAVHKCGRNKGIERQPGPDRASADQAPRRPFTLLLQGPAGPFFRCLQQHLAKSGFDAWRITFNAGDRLFSDRKRIGFEGDLNAWECWLKAFLNARPVQCIILFGCMRPVHVVARRLAAAAGVPILSLEEGYIRPGFITVEVGGNNASSPFAGRLPLGNAPAKSPRKPPEDFRSFPAMCRYGALYYAAVLFSSRGERELLHRHCSAVTEAFCWLRNFWRYHRSRRRDRVLADHLRGNCSGSYFLVPLQVASDGQMAHAYGWTTQKLVGVVLTSFARHAADSRQLVFKVHPLERGHNIIRHEVARLAAALGVGQRVHVVESGPLGPLVQACSGMITINSTSGLSAIFHGVPLLVVGDAIYSHPKLAICAAGEPDFDAFWQGDQVAEAELRQNYLDTLIENCLTPGDFYCRQGIALACAGIVARLQEIESVQSRVAAELEASC